MFSKLASTDPDRSYRRIPRQFWSKLARYAGAPLPWYHVPRAESQNRGDGTIHRSRRNEPWQEYAFNLEMFECYTSVSLGWHVLDLLDAFSPPKKDRQVTGHGIFWGLFPTSGTGNCHASNASMWQVHAAFHLEKAIRIVWGLNQFEVRWNSQVVRIIAEDSK